MNRNLLFIVIALLVCRALYLALFPVYDDAFITYRYAANLVDHGAFTYNLDDMVLGTTAPLFGLLCALFYWLGFDLPSTIPVFNILIDLAICLITYRQLSARNYLVGFVFAFVYSISPIVGRIAVGGMEANLFVLVSLLAFLIAQKGYMRSSVALASLAFFVRPEAVVTVAVILFFDLLKHKNIRISVVNSLCALIVPLLGMAIIYFFYGVPLPQSIIAKSNLERVAALDIVNELLFADPVSIALFPVAVAGFVLCFRGNLFLQRIGLWGLLYLSAYVLGGPKVWSWYALPLQFSYIVGAAFAASAFNTALAKWSVFGERYAGGVFLILACMFAAALYGFKGNETITKNIYSEIDKFCASLDKSRVSILAGDVGVIGYHCRPAKILDTAALVWPEAAKYKTDEEILEYHKADYVLMVATAANASRFVNSEVGKNYLLIDRYSIDGKSPISVDRGSFSVESGWVQEYMLFRYVVTQ